MSTLAQQVTKSFRRGPWWRSYRSCCFCWGRCSSSWYASVTGCLSRPKRRRQSSEYCLQNQIPHPQTIMGGGGRNHFEGQFLKSVPFLFSRLTYSDDCKACRNVAHDNRSMALLSKSVTKNCSSSPARMTGGETRSRKVIRGKRKSTDNRQAVFGHHKSCRPYIYIYILIILLHFVIISF